VPLIKKGLLTANKIQDPAGQIRLEFLFASLSCPGTSTRAHPPVTVTGTQSRDADKFCSFHLTHAGTVQPNKKLTDISNSPSYDQIHCIKQGFISHQCQNFIL
jgi:hypothetical protein